MRVGKDRLFDGGMAEVTPAEGTIFKLFFENLSPSKGEIMK
jgi:hypothetical protein